MKRKLGIILILITMLSIVGCQKVDANLKTVGENYEVNLYGNNGKLIKTYRASSYLKDKNGATLQVDGDPVYISGTITIEPIKNKQK